MKNPWLVAILNFFTIGLGTILVGKRPIYGALMFLGWSLLRYEEVRIGPAISGVFSIHWLIATVGLTMLGLAMGRAAYDEASQA